MRLTEQLTELEVDLIDKAQAFPASQDRHNSGAANRSLRTAGQDGEGEGLVIALLAVLRQLPLR